MSGTHFTTAHPSQSTPLRALVLSTALLGGILLLPAAAQAQARTIGGEQALLNRTANAPQGPVASTPVAVDGAWALTARHGNGPGGGIDRALAGPDTRLSITAERALRNAVALRTAGPESQR